MRHIQKRWSLCYSYRQFLRIKNAGICFLLLTQIYKIDYFSQPPRHAIGHTFQIWNFSFIITNICLLFCITQFQFINWLSSLASSDVLAVHFLLPDIAPCCTCLSCLCLLHLFLNFFLSLSIFISAFSCSFSFSFLPKPEIWYYILLCYSHFFSF